ncbi:MAG: formate dehydrogenase subunit gamma, partial [Dehalococcoidia bacterium]|nr:formate dehydrogenase subunit gamma [Dehalococcoidia bacterium]
FNTWERIIHWTTAIAFVILAVSGIVMLFGRYVILPALGYTVFSWLAALSKNLHNFVGPLFVVCTVLMFVTFVKNNLWRAYDWMWFRKLGGMFGNREHVPSGKFNAGEKSWFWFGVTLLGIVVSVTGLILDFPNFGQGRATMQLANVIHAAAAVLFMAAFLGHLYLGTIGVEGAYEAMRNGLVDETWAKEHHEYWYNEVKGAQQQGAAGAPSPAAAAPLRDAARHLFGLGLITMLILGMARLIAPVFAVARTESRGAGFPEHAPFWLLAAALVVRAGAGLASGTASYEAWMHAAALAGVLAWLAIAVFAADVLTAARNEARNLAAIDAAALGGNR